jgi:DNA repair protein RecO (recombination protein O)
MILSATPIGDYDKRIVILTKEKEKITAFAKGARKPNSPLLGLTNPFSFGEFEIYEGKNSNTLMQGRITNYFMELNTDFEGAYYGFYFMEIADYYTKEYNDEREMLKLLYQTLRALTSGKINRQLVRYIYELKTLAIQGEAPESFQCANCGVSEREFVFSSMNHGIICSECVGIAPDAITLCNSTLYAMQFIIATGIEKLYTFAVSEEVLEELGRMMSQYMKTHVDKRFKSLEILEMCLK